VKTSIVIASFNKLEYTQKCIESIRQYTLQDTYEIIVVDNGSTDDSQAWLSLQQDIKLIANSSNLGFPKACNQGMEIAEGDTILLLNNDTVVTENWLTNMRKALFSDDKVGAVGTVTNSISYYQAIQATYANLEEMQQFAYLFNVSNPLQWEERLKLIGYCMLIKKSVVEQIGLLDEQFSPGNYEDDDYSLRIRMAGYRLLLCKDTFIHHFGSTSFRENKEYTDLMKINRHKFMNKWGFDPDVSQVIHQEIVQMIRKPTHLPLRVLEIGSDCGGTLLQIKSNYPNAELYGMEANEAERNSLALAADTLENLQELAVRFNVDFFDVILVSRLIDGYSEQTLIEQLMPYLKTNGVLLTQLPNLLYYRVAYNFLQGRVSRSQLAYYKSSEIEPLFHELGMKQVEVNAITGYIPAGDEPFIKQLSVMSGLGMEEPYRIHSFYVRSTRLSRVESICIIINDLLSGTEGQDHLQALQFYSSEEVIEVVIKNSGGADDILNILAISAYENGQYDWAQSMLNKAFEINRDCQDTFYNMAVVLQAKGENQLALEWLQLINDQNEELIQFIQQLQHEANQKRFIESELKHILRRVEFDIERLESIYTLLNWLEEDEANFDLLIFNLEQQVIHKVRVLNLIAIGAFEEQKYDFILDLLQKALVYEPEDADTLYNLVFVLFQFGEKDLAHQYQQKLRTNDQKLIAVAHEVKAMMG
jgi:GT2 family glycosyltransferase